MIKQSQENSGNEFHEFYLALREENQFEAQWELFMKAMEPFGICGAAYGSVPILQMVEDLSKQEILMHFDYPENRMKQYDSLGGIENDYTVYHCFTKDSVLLWSHLKKVTHDGVLPTPMQKLHETMFQFDWNVGAMIPLPIGRDLGKAGVGLLAGKDRCEKDFDQMLTAKQAEITSYCEVFHYVAQTDHLARQHYGVDELKEQEWLSLEYSHLGPHDCGQQMGISKQQAAIHRRNAAIQFHLDSDGPSRPPFLPLLSRLIQRYYKVKRH